MREELKKLVSFTLFGAVTGVFVMFACRKMPPGVSYDIFYVLHPIYVVLSALVTSSMYKIHECKAINGKCLKGKCNFWFLVIIGYAGSVGIATISDLIIPYMGETLLDMPNTGIHIGFIEKWWLVNPLAFLGIAIAVFRPETKFHHAGHVLLSTWASLFHIIMATGTDSMNLAGYAAIFFFFFRPDGCHAA